MRHRCTARCTALEHVELVYTAAAATEGHIAQAYGYWLGVRVTRTEPAPEAPPYDPTDPGGDTLTGRRDAPHERAWLVSCRE